MEGLVVEGRMVFHGSHLCFLCNPVLKGQPKIHEGREGSKGSALSSKFHLHDHP
jgi:hypothetical protein